MSDADRTLWVAARDDYEKARKIAQALWPEAEDTVVQAATATLLIHHKDLSRENRVHVRVPPAAVKGDVVASQGAAGDIPSCPQCGGAVEANPNKRSEKAPDYVCIQENGPCGKRSKDGKYFNKTGIWNEKLNPNGAKGNAHPIPAGGYDQRPAALDDPADGDLPF
jgi:hypothetical protein